MGPHWNFMTLDDTPSTGNSTSSDSERATDDVRHEPASDTPISNAIIEAVAAVTEARPEDLCPLYEVIEPDALDQIFAPTGPTGAETTRTGYVVFSYEGCSVCISSDRQVVVTPPEDV